MESSFLLFSIACLYNIPTEINMSMKKRLKINNYPLISYLSGIWECEFICVCVCVGLFLVGQEVIKL